MTKRPPASRPPKGYRRRSLGSPGVPLKQHKWAVSRSSEVRQAAAWVEAFLQQDTERGQIAYFDTVVLGEMARTAGQMSAAARYLPPDSDPRWSRMFTLPPGEPVRQLLGWHGAESNWRPDENWYPGEAGLTPRESEAMHLAIMLTADEDDHGIITVRRFEKWEIAREMTPKKLRGDRSRWIPEKTVNLYLWRARVKLRALLVNEDLPGWPPEGESEAL